ncbi:cornifelin-like [Rhinatrema bivittatum]|uniref:cornifelin-like n=1 Tax=Rhinatrema bivittatum TaxID=194408 RepID=UPI00112BB9EE|nr:cornifelin-like [Rhinatrema bivittatum]
MAALTAQPQTVTPRTVTVVRGTDWSTGLYDCSDDWGICCCAFWCFSCFMCRTASQFGECMCLPLLDPFCLGYLGSPVPCAPGSMAMRAAMRERYRIQGSICSDCAVLCCCYTCAWCQMARELKKRKQSYRVVAEQTTSITVPSAGDATALAPPPQ